MNGCGRRGDSVWTDGGESSGSVFQVWVFRWHSGGTPKAQCHRVEGRRPYCAARLVVAERATVGSAGLALHVDFLLLTLGRSLDRASHRFSGLGSLVGAWGSRAGLIKDYCRYPYSTDPSTVCMYVCVHGYIGT